MFVAYMFLLKKSNNHRTKSLPYVQSVPFLDHA